MTCVFHSDCVFAVDIPLHFGIEECESFLVVIEEERFDEVNTELTKVNPFHIRTEP